MPETQNIEYKQGWHDDYLKWVCGFANAIGGIIYIGKNDSGRVVHLADYARLMEDIPNKIRNTMGIICDVQLKDDKDDKYISIKVNPYSVAVSLRGRYYYRSGSTKMELTGVELNEFLLKKSGKTWDDVIEEGATITDIDENSIAKFIDDSKDKGRMPETKGLSTFQILEKLQLNDGHKLRRAAIILFGKDPSRFYPNIQVKIGHFGKDATDLKFQEIVEGNLVQMLDEAQVQLNYKFLTRPVDFVGIQRVEKDKYPRDALREMLLNAMVHRTYRGASIQLRVYDDKLSIWNEGGLPLGMSLADLKIEHNSRPRNPKIAEACFKAGYIDTWGRGTLKIIKACKEAGLPEPEISEMNGGVGVTLFNNLQAKPFGAVPDDFGTISERIALGGEKNTGYLRGIYGVFTGYLYDHYHINAVEVSESFGERALHILQLMVLKPEINRQQIAAILGVSLSTIEKILAALRKNGLIKRRGSDKTGNWEITVKDNYRN